MQGNNVNREILLWRHVLWFFVNLVAIQFSNYSTSPSTSKKQWCDSTTLSQTLKISAKLLPHVFNHQKFCLKGGLMPGEHFERRRVWGSVQREPDRFFGMMVSCVRRLRPPVEGTCRLWGDPGPGEVEEGFRWSILILLGLLSGDAFYRVQESIWSWNIIDLSFLFWFRLLILSVIGVVFLLQIYM